MKRRPRNLVRVLNPAIGGDVEALFRVFKGRDSISIRVRQAPLDAPEVLAQLGGLVELRLANGELLEFDPRKTKLCADGDQKLYIVGRYTLPGYEKFRNYYFGRVNSVIYHARKEHIEDGEPTDYEHHFGDEGGTRPRLLLKDGYLILKDGSYWIDSIGIHD